MTVDELVALALELRGFLKRDGEDSAMLENALKDCLCEIREEIGRRVIDAPKEERR